MEKYTMFMNWKNKYSENEYTTQSNLQIQYNPYQTTNGVFRRTGTNNFTICIKIIPPALYIQIPFYTICVFLLYQGVSFPCLLPLNHGNKEARGHYSRVQNYWLLFRYDTDEPVYHFFLNHGIFFGLSNIWSLCHLVFPQLYSVTC